MSDATDFDPKTAYIEELPATGPIPPPKQPLGSDPPAPSGVDAEMLGYPKEQSTHLRFHAIRRIRVAWAQRYAWEDYILGQGLWTVNHAGYPYNTGGGTTIAGITGIGVEPYEGRITEVSGYAAQAQYDFAILTLHYECGYSGSAFLIEELTPLTSSEYLAVPQLYWADTSLVKDSFIPVYRGGWTYTVRWPRLAALTSPWTNGFAVQDVVNQAALQPRLFSALSFPIGTVLYKGPQCTATLFGTGTTRYNLTYVCHVRAVDWNKRYNPLTQTWSYQYSDAAATQQVYYYPQADLSFLN